MKFFRITTAINWDEKLLGPQCASVKAGSKWVRMLSRSLMHTHTHDRRETVKTSTSLIDWGEALFDESRRGLTPPGARFNQTPLTYRVEFSDAALLLSLLFLSSSSVASEGLITRYQVLRVDGPLWPGTIVSPSLIYWLWANAPVQDAFFLLFVASGDKKRGSFGTDYCWGEREDDSQGPVYILKLKKKLQMIQAYSGACR